MSKVQSMLYTQEQVDFLLEKVYKIEPGEVFDAITNGEYEEEDLQKLFPPTLKLLRTRDYEQRIDNNRDNSWITSLRPIIKDSVFNTADLIVNNNMTDITERWKLNMLYMTVKDEVIVFERIDYKRDINKVHAPLSVIIMDGIKDKGNKRFTVEPFEIYETFLSQFELHLVTYDISISRRHQENIKKYLKEIYRRDDIVVDGNKFILNNCTL